MCRHGSTEQEACQRASGWNLPLSLRRRGRHGHDGVRRGRLRGLSGLRGLGVITPFGGLAFLSAWAMLAYGVQASK